MSLATMNTKHLIVIVGPTAIGKTSLSINLAKYYNTEIISADSRQFFKELLIGTAPPSKKELSIIRHHFVQHISIEEEYNVGKFEKQAIKKIEELFCFKDKLILVGGSGLYIDAICYGLDEMPKISSRNRDEIRQLYKNKGINFLLSELKEKDPIFYEQVDKRNPQRLMRALEVIYSANKPFSSFRKRKVKKRNFNIVKVGLQIGDRNNLYNKINTRVDYMIKKGLIEEVESLKKHRNKNALQTVGYKEIFEYFDGKHTLEEAIDKIKQNTRRFAKRQITWNNRDKDITYFSPSKINDIINFIG